MMVVFFGVFAGFVFLVLFMFLGFGTVVMRTAVGKFIFMIHAPVGVDGAARGERDRQHKGRAYRPKHCCEFFQSHKQESCRRVR